MWIKTLEQRPEEGQKIFYYFEPFESYHVGKYDSESDSVYGKSGFTTVIPEVPYWMAIPSLPESEMKKITDEEEYDVVADTLQKQIDVLWKMTERNMNHDMFNIMDQIRLEQIDELKSAMKIWREHKQQVEGE